MSIYISGLEMPQEGRITLQIDSGGGVYVVNKFKIFSEKYEESMTATEIQPHDKLGFEEGKKIGEQEDLDKAWAAACRVLKEWKPSGAIGGTYRQSECLDGITAQQAIDAYLKG